MDCFEKLVLLPGVVFCILFFRGCNKDSAPAPTARAQTTPAHTAPAQTAPAKTAATPTAPVPAQNVGPSVAFLQAAPNDWVYVSAGFDVSWDGGLGGGFHVQRIEWDANGNTTKIDGIDPKFDGAFQWTITSSKLVDGILLVTFKEKDTKEYKFKIVSGKIVSIQ